MVGSVYAADTRAPIAKVQITNRENPQLSVESGPDGKFHIPAESSLSPQLLMAGSHLHHEIWLVSHPDYAPAVALTSTIAPPLEEQLSTLSIPLFSELPESPPGCPFGQYLLAVGESILGGTENNVENYITLLSLMHCRDDNIGEKLEAIQRRVWQSRD